MVAISRYLTPLATTLVALLLPSTVAIDTYDVVVIGSGAGGLVAAEYLSRDSSIKVLVLEAGGPSLKASGGTDGPYYAGATGLTKFDIPSEYGASGSITSSDNQKYWVGTSKFSRSSASGPSEEAPPKGATVRGV